MITIGADPGKNGGAICVLRDRAPSVLSWRKAGKRIVSRTICRGAVVDFTDPVPPRLAQFVRLIGEPHAAAVERVDPHSGKGNGLVSLAEDAGGIVALILAAHPWLIVHRPQASAWQLELLDLAYSVKADDRERAAIAWVQGHAPLGWTGRAVDLAVDWTAPVPPNAHEADAVCFAVLARGL